MSKSIVSLEAYLVSQFTSTHKTIVYGARSCCCASSLGAAFVHLGRSEGALRTARNSLPLFCIPRFAKIVLVPPTSLILLAALPSDGSRRETIRRAPREGWIRARPERGRSPGPPDRRMASTNPRPRRLRFTSNPSRRARLSAPSTSSQPGAAWQVGDDARPLFVRPFHAIAAQLSSRSSACPRSKSPTLSSTSTATR